MNDETVEIIITVLTCFLYIIFGAFILYASYFFFLGMYEYTTNSSFCLEKGYTQYQSVDNTHFNCCKESTIIEDNKYVKDTICVRSDRL